MCFGIETMRDVEIVKNIVEIVTQSCVAASLIFASWKWGKGQKTTRARYLKVLIGEYNKDAIQDFCIDLQFSPESTQVKPGDNQFKKNMRKTLLFFSYLCHAYHSGLIDSSEFSFFEAQIKRVVQDERVGICLKQGSADYAALICLAQKRMWIQ